MIILTYIDINGRLITEHNPSLSHSDLIVGLFDSAKMTIIDEDNQIITFQSVNYQWVETNTGNLY